MFLASLKASKARIRVPVQALNTGRTYTNTKKDVKMKEIKSLADFNALKNGKKTLVVDFYASWCPPCKMIAPFFAQLAEAFTGDKAEFVKVNVDEAGEIAQQEGIRAMPTFKAYREGKKLGELLGADKNQLQALVENNIKL